MDLKKISDHELLSKTKILIKKEHELAASIILHLEEIERRKLYTDLKYPSLWEYCVNELGYTRSQAYRRINAMKMGRSIPEVREGLKDGKLNISTVNLASEFFSSVEVLDMNEKRKIFVELEGKSKRQAEKHLADKKAQLGPDLFVRPKEIAKELDSGDVRLHLTLSKETMEKLNRLNGLLAHKKVKRSTDELLSDVLDIAIAKVEKEKFAKVQTPRAATRDHASTSPTSRNIPAETRREVYTRAGACCQNCGGVFALELDHVKAVAKGGTDEVDNLRILCRSCNTRHAIADFGADFMQKFNGTTLGHTSLLIPGEFGDFKSV